MLIKAYSDKKQVVYVDTESCTKYEFTLGHLIDIDNKSYDINVVMQCTSDFINESKDVKMVDFWYGEIESMEDAILVLMENQKFGKKYDIEFF